MTPNDEYSKLFIGGEWVDSLAEEWITITSPFTEQPIARVPAASSSDVDRAVTSARHAFDHGAWPHETLEHRMAVIRRLVEQLDANQDLIASTVSAEMGSPITQARALQAAGPSATAASFLEMAPRYPFTSLREAATGTALVTREPVGVVAAIVPWNVPLTISILKLVPALLTGCTVILKPAPETPLNAYLLARLCEAAGLPRGVLSVLAAHREVSEHLVTHPEVDKVTFTGSSAAGRRIAALCGEDLRRVTLELGGKSAAVILPDADLESTIESLRHGSLRNSGQVCSLKTRIVVPRTLHAEIVDRLTTMVSSMPVGDPADPATQIGPMVTARQRERVENYIEIGRQEGARVALGGSRPTDLPHGWFVEPTVFTDVVPSMRIAQDEIFGPVLCVLAYDDESEAVAIANDSEYGLNGAVYTSDLEHGVEVARKIRTGTVELNGRPAGHLAPSGGFKTSGIGREKGFEGFDPYIELKSIALPAEWAHKRFARP